MQAASENDTRNLDDLRQLVKTLTDKGVRVEFVKGALTFTGEDSPMAMMMLSVMGALAEFERSLILERQREGIGKAKQRGVYKGRKPARTAEQASELAARARRRPHLRRRTGQPRDGIQLSPGAVRRILTRNRTAAGSSQWNIRQCL